MTTLTSGLKLIDLGTEGWDAIFNFDMELLDEKLVSVMTANKDLGEGTLSDNTGSMTSVSTQQSTDLTDSTTGTPTQTINDCGASYSQTTLNDNFASVTDEIKKLVVESTDYKARIDEIETYLGALKTSHNNLLSELRKTTGCGVLGG